MGTEELITERQSGSDPKNNPEGGATGSRRGLLMVLGGGLLLVSLLACGMILIPRYRAANPASDLQRSDADRVDVDDIYLDLTLVTPSFLRSRKLEHYLGGRDADAVLPFLIGVNTHKGSIQHMHHLGGRLLLIGPDGSRYPSITEPIVISQHHNAYMGLFPARDNRGERFLDKTSGLLSVEIAGVGRTPVHRFQWRLPMPSGINGASSRGLLNTAMLVVAVIGALLVVLSPCALELTLYYSAIISCTVAQGEQEAADSGKCRVGRHRILANLCSFVLGFTLLYAISGATVGLIGQGVRSPLGEYGNMIQTAGGMLILFFALRVLGVGRWLKKLASSGTRKLEFFAPFRSRLPNSSDGHGKDSRNGGLWWPGRVLARLRLHGLARSRRRRGVNARDSFLAGMGLSSSCLTCMGGAVLYPLLVYAGITSWYWGLVTLALFSLGIAVPMVLITLGFFRIRLSLGSRLGINRNLRLASGVLLCGIGFLILTGRERIVTDLAFGLLGTVSRWLA